MLTMTNPLLLMKSGWFCFHRFHFLFLFLNICKIKRYISQSHKGEVTVFVFTHKIHAVLHECAYMNAQLLRERCPSCGRQLGLELKTLWLSAQARFTFKNKSQFHNYHMTEGKTFYSNFMGNSGCWNPNIGFFPLSRSTITITDAPHESSGPQHHGQYVWLFHM